MTVLVLGGVNMDFIVEAPVIAGRGETREGSAFYTTPGGKGANQAVAAARILAGRVAVEMAGMLGDDRYSEEMRSALEAAGVGTAHLGTAVGAHCGVAVILIDGTGENSVNAVYGSNLLVDEALARAAAAAHLDAGSVLLVQQETPLPATVAAMHLARERGATVILDPAPTREHAAHLLSLADIVTPNEHEAAELVGHPVDDADSAREAARALRARGAGAVIVTLAALGAWVEADGISELVPSFPVTPIATVGAGDAFNGGVASGLALGLGLREAARMGAAAGALCVTRRGAQEAMAPRAEVESLLAASGG
ncbi:MAG: ribokinase [Chloroflexi bacterium]|nr:ribokinase [Chloroflexota bacterium]MDA1147518.1 ribokinase [Chloroflexota bacterium]